MRPNIQRGPPSSEVHYLAPPTILNAFEGVSSSWGRSVESLRIVLGRFGGCETHPDVVSSNWSRSVDSLEDGLERFGRFGTHFDVVSSSWVQSADSLKVGLKRFGRCGVAILKDGLAPLSQGRDPGPPARVQLQAYRIAVPPPPPAGPPGGAGPAGGGGGTAIRRQAALGMQS